MPIKNVTAGGRKVTFLRHIVLPDGRLIIRKSKPSNAECEGASNLP